MLIAMQKKTKETLLVLLRAAVALTLFAVAVINYDKLSTLSVENLVSVTDDTTLMAAIVLGIYLLKSLVFVVPASLVYVAVGVIFNPVAAVLLNLTGIFIEVTVTYFLGRFLGGKTVEHLLMKKKAGRKLLEANIQGKASVLLGIRAVPAFPIDFVSLFYGASRCSYLKYALLSELGISWRVILFTILGSKLFDWIPMDKIILAVICCIPVGVAVYLVKKLMIDRKKLSGQHSDANGEETDFLQE